jgi:putative tricarboxylic transport membrane protein
VELAEIIWQIVPFMLLGILTGALFGIIPGTSGVTALILLMPLGLVLTKEQTVALLLGAYCPAFTGGSITSILLGVPGTGGNAATILDGFPLGQAGKGPQAVGAALTSSAIGGLIGAVILWATIPLLKALILLLATPDYLMLILLGISVIGLVSSEGTKSSTITSLKGLLSGIFGILLSFIGSDLVTGSLRYTFGLSYLWDGIGIVTVALGLFGLSRIIELIAVEDKKREKQESTKSNWFKGVLDGCVETAKSIHIVIGSSVIGAILGAIPAVGANTAIWVAYAQAKRISKRITPFGAGNLDGVIAPEACNNASEGGSRVPTIGFGIPGSVGMAILMGALLVAGLEIGPKMLREQPNLIYEMIWIVAFANVVGAVLVAFIGKYVDYISTLQRAFLASAMLILMVSGTYVGGAGAVGSVSFAIAFGILGFFMRMLSYSRPALLLGFILGNIAERDLALVMQTYGWSFLSRPTTLSLLILDCLVLFFGIMASMKSEGQVYLKNGKMEMGFLVTILTIGGLLFFDTFSIPTGVTRTVPFTIISLLFGLGAIIFVSIIFYWRRGHCVEEIKAKRKESILGIGFMILCGLLVWFIGLYLGVALSLFIGNKLIWKKSLPISLLIAFIGFAFLWGAYEYLFTHIRVWWGLLFSLF